MKKSNFTTTFFLFLLFLLNVFFVKWEKIDKAGVLAKNKSTIGVLGIENNGFYFSDFHLQFFSLQIWKFCGFWAGLRSLRRFENSRNFGDNQRLEINILFGMIQGFQNYDFHHQMFFFLLQLFWFLLKTVKIQNYVPVFSKTQV